MRKVSGTESCGAGRKHAYLILAHKNAPQVARLIRAIDHPENRFFVHVDKKAPETLRQLTELCENNPRVIFAKPRACTWGSYQLVSAEIALLQMAGPDYSYYHLLSGQDYPLRPQDEIREAFESRKRQFVHFSPKSEWPNIIRERVSVTRHPAFAGRSTRCAALERKLAHLQMSLMANRTDPAVRYGYGSQWFSIRSNLAMDFANNEAWVSQHFGKSFCSDEFALQSFVLTFGYEDELAFPIGTPSEEACMRCIDWSGGGAHPQLLREADERRLFFSPGLFARKLDLAMSPKLFDDIDKHIFGEPRTIEKSP